MLAKLWLDGKLAKRSLSRYLFRRDTGIFLLGPVTPKKIKGAGDLVGKVGPSSPYVTMQVAIVGKLWLWGNGVLNISKKTPLSKQNKPFLGGVGFPAVFLWPQK